VTKLYTLLSRVSIYANCQVYNSARLAIFTCRAWFKEITCRIWPPANIRKIESVKMF